MRITSDKCLLPLAFVTIKLLESNWINLPSLPPQDDVFCNGEGAETEGTHRDTEEGEAQEQAAKVYHFSIGVRANSSS